MSEVLHFHPRVDAWLRKQGFTDIRHEHYQDSVIAPVDEYSYQDEWRNDGREIGDSL